MKSRHPEDLHCFDTGTSAVHILQNACNSQQLGTSFWMHLHFQDLAQKMRIQRVILAEIAGMHLLCFGDCCLT